VATGTGINFNMPLENGVPPVRILHMVYDSFC